jgi:hypothetical protein
MPTTVRAVYVTNRRTYAECAHRLLTETLICHQLVHLDLIIRVSLHNRDVFPTFDLLIQNAGSLPNLRSLTIRLVMLTEGDFDSGTV